MNKNQNNQANNNNNDNNGSLNYPSSNANNPE